MEKLAIALNPSIDLTKGHIQFGSPVYVGPRANQKLKMMSAEKQVNMSLSTSGLSLPAHSFFNRVQILWTRVSMKGTLS